MSHLSERFWRNVEKTSGCWLWVGKRHRQGYGWFWVDGKKCYAHRIAFAALVEPIPQGLWVLHHCDTPACIRPDHLYLGTHADNMRDRQLRGRTARGDRSGLRVHPERAARGDRNGSRMHPERLKRGDESPARLHPERMARGDKNGARLHPERLRRGEQVAISKLTAEKVIEMRAARAGGESVASIALRFGVCCANASIVLRRLTWRHVS